MTRPPVPPFTEETARIKVRAAEDAWNSRNPAKIALAYTSDSHWRNRAEFVKGRPEIEAFLTRKWAQELDYRLIKELWTFADDRIAVRFAYEWRAISSPSSSNPPLYPAWQAYFRRHQPPTLVVWGKNDFIFPADGAHPYKRDLKTLEFHLLDTGHFALEEDGDEIARLIRRFLNAHIP